LLLSASDRKIDKKIPPKIQKVRTNTEIAHNAKEIIAERVKNIENAVKKGEQSARQWNPHRRPAASRVQATRRYAARCLYTVSVPLPGTS
jgi:hypothetical protein